MPYDERKFEQFNKMLKDIKEGDVDMIIIAWPDVLGEDYEEVIENLSRIAECDLPLVITRRHP